MRLHGLEPIEIVQAKELTDWAVFPKVIDYICLGLITGKLKMTGPIYTCIAYCS
jgi:hypothetical protein